MNVSFGGLDNVCATFAISGEVNAGDPVKVSANGTVKTCAAGDAPLGFALDVRGGYASVLLRGYALVPYSGSVTVGWADIAADGSGGVKAVTGSAASRKVAVLDVDETEDMAGILL